ncbi:prepilin-type N-terminal cleavage/methylation domain-containing protein [Xylophilus rhododendri]|uniref:Prepilin-type N-terminal cleavage/methylation domain-containing protein n=1 Tax=Xylophilus rhododendri TaxID=2697032 RepID=A0A857J5N7_9BURK|nr:PilW family protein [Xylophilus rhododendri]QHI98155.1 prepilin-type N-terminal cleavage/methylation domain-containing protein [Xylophilus rhododendri]
MKPRSRPARGQRGFSLLELMIAVIIGMFSVLVILQVLGNTATSRRIAVAGGDAQLNGLAAVRAMTLDVEHAGLGLQSFNISGCSVSYTTSSDGASVTLPLAPVTINPATSLVPAGDANTDTLLVVSGNSGSPSEGDAVTSATASTAYVVTTPASFIANDRVVVAPATRAATCALQLATVGGVSGSVLTVSNGSSGLPSGSIVYNLGGTPTVRAYAVRNGDLTVCDYLAYNCGSSTYTSTVTPSVWVPVANNIASLRAQYARDTSGISGSTSTMDGIVDTYDQATPGSVAAVTIPLYCQWARVVGIRAAVVGRGQQYDKTLSYTGTSNASTAKSVLPLPVWDGSSTGTLNPTAVPITLSSGIADWDRYRYVVSQTTIPLRNAIWQGSQPAYQGGSGGC